MKRHLATFVLVACSCLSAAGAGKHLFILSGQSNMAGLNPAVSFTPTVEEALGKENVIVVKDAQGGQPIRRWHKEWAPKGGEKPATNGDLYERLMQKVTEAIAGQELASVTFVWMQGERDAKESHGEVYAASMNGLIEQLRTDLKRKELNFVIGRLSDFDMENKRYKHWTIVRDAQIAVAEGDSRGTWVDTDDLNNKEKGGKMRDDLHYTKDGYKTLGERFAREALALIDK